MYRFIQIAAGLPVCSIRVLHEGEMFFAVFVCDLSAPETSSSLVNARLKCSTTSTGSSFLTLYIGHASLLTPSGCWVPHTSLGLGTVRPSGSGLLEFSTAPCTLPEPISVLQVGLQKNISDGICVTVASTSNPWFLPVRYFLKITVLRVKSLAEFSENTF